MKYLLIGLMLLCSVSSFANPCSVENIENAIVGRYNTMTDIDNRIEIGGILSNFEHVGGSFLASLEFYLGTHSCPQFEGHQRRLRLKNLFRKEVMVNVVDESGVSFETKRKLTTTEIAERILDN
jgi:hypothetical protein